MTRILRLPLAALVVGLLAPSVPLCADDLGPALLAAVQREDVAEARRLLAAGAPVDAKTRYGATPLFFACDRGNAELVQVLLAQGATVDVVDTFYGASPIQWVLFKAGESEKHRALLVALLAKAAKGTDDVTAALLIGVETADLAVVQAAVEAEASEKGRRAALAAAKEGGKEAIVAYLADKTPPEPEGVAFALPAEALPRYAGEYVNDAMGFGVQVQLEGEKLSVLFPGQPASGLAATAVDQFEVAGAPGVVVRFTAPEGAPDGPRATMTIVQGEQEFLLTRKLPAAAEQPAVAAATPAAEPELIVARGPALPWPAFRGANRSGIADGQGMPRSWNVEKGESLAWKTRIPGLGLSSPVVWGDRVFVTSAISGTAGEETLRTGLYGDVDSLDDSSVHTWKVFALDAGTGSIVWERVASQGPPKVKRHMKSSHANPTAATDGKHLVVSFGSEGLFCYDLDGRLLWKKDLGVLSSGWFYDPAYEWGFGSSPIVHDGAAIVQVDIQEGSFVAAFDLATGAERWRTSRDEIPTWGTPTILPGSGNGPAEVVTNGTKVRGYDAATGAELWRLGPSSEVTVGSPVVADGIAYAVGGYPPVQPIYAIRAGARGDLTLPEGATSSAAIAWSTSRGGSYMPSPIVYRGLLYVFHNNGRLVAYDAATGEELYKARVGTGQGFTASPVAADGRLYFTAEDGVTYVVRAGRAFVELAANSLGEAILASPAISDGRLFLRGKDHVFALAELSPGSRTTAPAAGRGGGS